MDMNSINDAQIHLYFLFVFLFFFFFDFLLLFRGQLGSWTNLLGQQDWAEKNQHLCLFIFFSSFTNGSILSFLMCCSLEMLSVNGLNLSSSYQSSLFFNTDSSSGAITMDYSSTGQQGTWKYYVVISLAKALDQTPTYQYSFFTHSWN